MATDTEIQARAREYLRTRGTLVSGTVIHERVGAAFLALDGFLDAVPPGADVRPPRAGTWTVREIVDHLLETHRPGLDELRCLLAGERPPGDPIPASLRSRAPRLRPWPWLRRELRRVHDDILETLAAAPPDFTSDARAPLVMVVDRPGDEEAPLRWIEDLDWKAYAIVWRLHVLDHLGQAKRALGVP